MFVCWEEETLASTMQKAVAASPEHPVLLDRFLEDAFELDVDALCDGKDVVIGAVMQHIEEAGIHSGDSACVIPPYHEAVLRHEDEIKEMTRALALALGVRGLLNIQFAIQGDQVYVLEVNPRASRTVPFVSKATGLPLARLATQIMLGSSLKDLGVTERRVEGAVFIKEPVLPWARFAGEDPVLGPEMKSTGEVMGIGVDFGEAFLKAQWGAGEDLPPEGTVFLSVHDRDKPALLEIAEDLAGMGFSLLGTGGTAAFLRERGIAVEPIFKVNEGRPHVVDRMLSGDVQMVINTPLGAPSFYDERAIRFTALRRRIPLITTLTGAASAVRAIRARRRHALSYRCLQVLHEGPKR